MLISRWESWHCLCLIQCESKGPFWRAFLQRRIKLKTGILCDPDIAASHFISTLGWLNYIFTETLQKWFISRILAYLRQSIACVLPACISCLNDIWVENSSVKNPLSLKTDVASQFSDECFCEKGSSQPDSFSLCCWFPFPGGLNEFFFPNILLGVNYFLLFFSWKPLIYKLN